MSTSRLDTGRRAAAVAVAVAVLLAKAPASRGQCGRPQILHPKNPWGVSTEAATNTGQGPGIYGTAFGAGFRWVRLYFYWDQIEPNPPDAAGHHYNWGAFGAAVDNAFAENLDINVNIGRIPAWVPRVGGLRAECVNAANAQRAPDPSYVQQFAHDVAATFGAKVASWEIFSEPDICWHFGGTPQLYRGNLLKPAFDGIKQSGYPSIIAAPGIINSANLDPWLVYFDSQLNRRVLVRPIDYYSIHLYESPASAVTDLHAADGWSAPRTYDGTDSVIGYWLTEFGYGTLAPCAATASNPGNADTTLLDTCWYGTNKCYMAMVYQLSDFPGGTCNSGLIDANGNAKPAFTTVQQYLAANPVAP